MSDKISSNIWKYYLWRFFCGIVLTTPIYVLYMQENGLSVTQIMVLQSIYTALIIILSVFAGSVADKYGRKKSLVISTIAFSSAFFLFGISSTFLSFLIAEIMFAIADAFFMGVGEAFVYDSLKSKNHEQKYKKVQGTAYAISDTMRALSGIAGGFVAVAISMKATAFITIIPTAIAVIIVFFFKEPKTEKSQYNHIKHIISATKYIIGVQKLRFIIIYSAILGSIGYISFFMLQVYFQEVDLPIKMFGIIYALMFAGSAIGSKTCHSLEKYISDKNLIKLFVVSYAIITLLLGLTNYFLLGVLWWFLAGIRYPIISDIINKNTASHQRATVMSINQSAGNLAISIFAPLVGILIDNSSAHYTFIILSVFFMLYTVFVFGYLKKVEI